MASSITGTNLSSVCNTTSTPILYFAARLGLEYGLQEFAGSIPQHGFDRIEPIVEKVLRRLDFRLRQERRRAMARHGVISAGAQTPESLVDQAGDYAVFIFQPLPLRHLLRRLKSKKIRPGVTSRTTVPAPGRICGRTHRLEPIPRQSAVRPHPARALSACRTNVRSCSAPCPPSPCGRRRGLAQNRGHHRRQAGEAVKSPVFQAPAQKGIARGKFPVCRTLLA
jgi:hypothetical protein